MEAIANAKASEVSEILEREDLSVIRLQREIELLEEYATRAEKD